MKSTLTLILAALLLAPLAALRAAAPKARPERAQAKTPEPAKSMTALFPEFDHTPNIVYKTVGDEKLLLDLLTPKAMKGDAAPLLVHIHGGGWGGGDRHSCSRLDVRGVFQRCAAAGIVCATIEYRLNTPKATVFDSATDCKDALRFLVKNAKQYRIDADRIGTIGGSAGGHLSLVTALGDPKDFPGDPALAGFDPKAIRCEVAYYPATDFTDKTLAERFLGRRAELMFGGPAEQTTEIIRSLSPVHLIKKDSPPIYCFHGDRDDVLHVENSRRLFAKGQAVGADIHYTEVKNGTHGFGRDCEPSVEEIAAKAAEFIIARLTHATISVGAPPQAATAAPQAKSPLRGLVQMGDIGFHRQDGGRAHPELGDLLRFPAIFGGTVINITWDQLEPNRGKLVTTEIDRMLDDIRAYNQSHPQHPLGARLRVWPGVNAPIWAKSLDGPPVKVLHKNMPITVGRFWAPAYRKAWRELLTRLAARYDGETLIHEVSNTSGSSMTAEAMLLPADPQSIKNLRAAGFTDQQYQACLLESPADYAGWAATCIECIVNPYRRIDTGKPQPDPELTLKIMRHWRQTLGLRAVLSNCALSNPPADHLVPIYQEIQRLGAPISFETHSPDGLDWEGTLRLGRSYGADSIELWSGTRFGGFETKGPQLLRQWADLFHTPAGNKVID